MSEQFSAAEPPQTPKTPSGSSAVQAAKRRRLNAAATTLSKPFRSPLRVPATTNTAFSTPSPLSTCSPQTTCTPPSPIPTPTKPTQPRRRPPRNFKSPYSTSKNSQDPELAALQSRHTELTNRIRTAKASLETVSQALKIESATEEDSDERLEELILKWKEAARGAADWMFGRAADRVNRMGGISAWKEMNGRSARWAEDDEEEEKRRLERLREEEGGEEIYDRDIGEERRLEEELKEEKGRHEESEREADEKGFTMEMMLKTLGIEMDLIGYDVERECWS